VTETLAPSQPTQRRLAGTPFVGLVPYGEGDAAFFFGRDEEKEIVAGNLRAARLTILYGASGVGKSSLLHAGVVHDLHNQVRANAAAGSARTPFAICAFSSWRDDPLPQLAEAMRAACVEALGGEELPSWRPGERLVDAVRAWTERVRPLLVVLDQFEDYFLYHAAEDGDDTFAVEFPRLVNEPNLHVNFVLSLREDAWAKLDRFEGRIPSLFANYVRVEHLDRKAARAAIEGPIREWNRRLPPGEAPYAVEPSLVETVIEAAAGGRAALTDGGNGAASEAAAADGVEAPFLQLVLERLWRETVAAGARTLDVGRLEALGGAQQIVENHLLEALGKLTPDEQAVAADLFRFLVTRSKTKIAHPAADLAEWTKRPEPEVSAVLEKLCRGESGRILRSVSPPAGETAASYELFHDVLGEPILEWRKQYEQRREQDAAAERQRALRRRLVRLVLALVLVALVFAAFAGWALYERRQAAQRTEVARSQALAAQATQALSGAPATALADSLEAVATSRTPQAERALRDALVSSRVRFVLPTGKPRASAFAATVPVESEFGPDGRLLLTTGADGVARLWNTASGSQAAALQVPGHRIVHAAFDRTARLVLTTGNDSTARLWRASTGREVARLRAPPGARLLAAAFGPRGPVVLVKAPHRPAELRDVQAPDKRVALAGGTERPQTAVFSPDATRLLTFGGSSGVRIFDTRSGKQLAVLRTRPEAASFSRDGRFVVTLGSSHVRVWRTATGTPVATLDPAVNADLSAHGRLLLTVYGDGSAIVWKLPGGKRIAVLPGFTNPPSAAFLLTFPPTGALSGDGRLAATTDLDGVRVWDTANGKLLGSVASGYARRLAFSPSGRLLASATGDGAVLVSQAVPSATVVTGHGPPNNNLCCQGFDPVLSPDRELVVAATGDGAALWRTDGRKIGALPQPYNTVVSTASFSADGSLVATNNLLNVAVSPLPPLVTTVWRTGDLKRVARIPGQSTVADLSPDGRFVVVDPGFGRTVVWSVSALAGIPPPPRDVVKNDRVVTPVDRWRRARLRARVPALDGALAFDPAGRSAVVSGGRRGVRIVDVPNGHVRSTLARGTRSLAGAAFNADGTRLVGRAGDGRIGLWDPASGRRVSGLGRFAGEWSARFSDDGKVVLVSSGDRVWVRRASDGKQIRSLPAPPGVAAFSPDGAFAAVPQEGGRLAIVDLAAGVTTEIQTGTAAALASAAFTPGSKALVAWDANGNLQIVDCEICAAGAALSALARDRLARIQRFRPPLPVYPAPGVG
jgi:WD40 repeat protein